MREAVVAMIGEQRADLLGALAGVGGTQWDAPTVCTGWSVKDVLAHMVEGELNVGRVYRGETPELGLVDPEAGVAKWRALPGEAVRAALWQHGVAAQRVLETMTEAGWRAPIAAFGCRQVSQLARLHLFDLVVHGHDLTDALGLAPVWGPRLPFVAEFVVRAAPPTLARRGVAAGGRLGVRVGERSWTIDGTDGAWRVHDDDGADAILTASAEDLVLATTGRADLGVTMARAQVEGDAAYATRMLEGWQVVAR